MIDIIIINIIIIETKKIKNVFKPNYMINMF